MGVLELLSLWSDQFLDWASWEGARNWIGTLGTVGSLGVAATTYMRNSAVKRQEQARLVYSHGSHLIRLTAGDQVDLYPAGVSAAAAGAGLKLVRDESSSLSSMAVAETFATHALVTVENKSKEIIGPVCVRLRYLTEDWKGSPGVVLQAVSPESSRVVSLSGSDEKFGSIRPVECSEVIFRDAGGKWWKRIGTNPVKRIRRKPPLVAGFPVGGANVLSFGTGFVYKPTRKEERMLRRQLDQESADQESADQESADQESADQESADQESADQESRT